MCALIRGVLNCVCVKKVCVYVCVKLRAYVCVLACVCYLTDNSFN